MSIEVVYETHSFSEDNERGVATGWHPGRLSERGRGLARALGERRLDNGIDVVFCSDLRRAVQTAEIAFEGSAIPILHDWRLRECDYGALNSSSSSELRRDISTHVDEPYPGGESWRQAVTRMGRFLDDLPSRWNGKRVLVIGHAATRWAMEVHLNGAPLEKLVAEEFEWQEGWEYRIKR